LCSQMCDTTLNLRSAFPLAVNLHMPVTGVHQTDGVYTMLTEQLFLTKMRAESARYLVKQRLKF
jgi:hypothetical protein